MSETQLFFIILVMTSCLKSFHNCRNDVLFEIEAPSHATEFITDINLSKKETD